MKKTSFLSWMRANYGKSWTQMRKEAIEDGASIKDLDHIVKDGLIADWKKETGGENNGGENETIQDSIHTRG